MKNLICRLIGHKGQWHDNRFNWHDDRGREFSVCTRCGNDCMYPCYYVLSAEGRMAPYEDDWTQEEADRAWMNYYNYTLRPEDKIRTSEELHAKMLGVSVRNERVHDRRRTHISPSLRRR
jgi:hypothetical protein